LASFEIRFASVGANGASGPYVGKYMAENVTFELNNSEEGGVGCEIPLSATQTDQPLLGIVRDSFAPKRTDWELWRNGVILGSGILTSVNLNKDRDTILVSGKDWLWYLKQRIYPFNPVDFVTFNATNPQMYATSNLNVLNAPGNWPKRWPKGHKDKTNPLNNPYSVSEIVKDILRSMRTGVPIDSNNTPGPTSITAGTPPFVFNIPAIGTTTKYKIYPGDSTSIFDHIKKLSEATDGFEFDIFPLSLEFKLWWPRRDTSAMPEYFISVQNMADFNPNTASGQAVLEAGGMIAEFDWTNDGPDGTYLLGLGTRGQRVGQVWTTLANVTEFRRLDLVYDFGELSNTAFLLQMLKDQNDLHPQKKLELTLWNPEFLSPSFYTGGRPRTLIGRRIRVTNDFAPYHQVVADFRINNIRLSTDQSTNESVALGLEMIYE
jgi:hypothetical protein